jgi:hypothetical protein
MAILLPELMIINQVSSLISSHKEIIDRGNKIEYNAIAFLASTNPSKRI